MTSADRPPMSRRERLMWVYKIAGPVGALALAAVMAFIFRPTRHARPFFADPAQFATAMVLIAVIMGWSFTFAWLTARKEDEYTLAGAKFAWFWGGLIGLVCSVPVMSFIAWGGLTMIDPVDFHPSREKEVALIFGYMLAVLFQFLGFLVARVWWGMRRP